jgi:hypothetical protein
LPAPFNLIVRVVFLIIVILILAYTFVPMIGHELH